MQHVKHALQRLAQALGVGGVPIQRVVSGLDGCNVLPHVAQLKVEHRQHLLQVVCVGIGTGFVALLGRVLGRVLGHIGTRVGAQVRARVGAGAYD